MMPLRAAVRKNLDKLETLELETICPSHGPMYGNPGSIVAAYRDWVDGSPRNLAVIPYVTMHGSTLRMVDHLTDSLSTLGVRVERFDLTTIDLGRLAAALVDTATLLVATPTVLTNPHPAMMSALYTIGALRPTPSFVGIVATYGWASHVVDVATSLIANLKAEMLDPILIKGSPRAEDLAQLDMLAQTVARKHAEAGIA
jgi:flavorubredoxin